MTNKGFKQIVNFITTEGATTLDHVYLSSSINAKVQKIPTYYSYHDALMLKLTQAHNMCVLYSVLLPAILLKIDIFFLQYRLKFLCMSYTATKDVSFKN